jgi:hypothetical protein
MSPAVGTIAGDYVLGGSSVRGALAHRALFHFNSGAGRRIQVGGDRPTKPEEFAAWRERSAELLALFGEAKPDVTSPSQGRRSALIVEDVVFKPRSVMALDHNSLDRFSGGARNGVLFSEELVCSDPVTIEIVLDNRRLSDAMGTSNLTEDQIDQARAALRAAIDDLCQSRLALGAKSSGYFTAVARSDHPRKAA